jgi:signal peptidase I
VKLRARVWLWPFLVAAAVFLTTKYLVTPYVVFGQSMQPTLQPWDICLMARVRHYTPMRGEIVMFRTADDPPLYFVKRVVGLPGDAVGIRAGIIHINGRALDSPRLSPTWEASDSTLPADKMLVVADNPDYGHGVVAVRLVRARLLWHWRWKR